MELRVEAHVATVTGVADEPFESVSEALSSLTDGYACRAIVMPLDGPGTAPGLTAAQTLWLEQYPIPLIAALSGNVTGGGAAYALACDIRVAAPLATIGVSAFGTRRVLRLLGEWGSVLAMESGGSLGGEVAMRAGIVSALAEDPLAEALRLAAGIASRGPIATRFAKEAIWRGLEMPLEQGLRMETDLTVLLQSTKDRAEGVAAFVEKRAPAFRGE